MKDTPVLALKPFKGVWVGWSGRVFRASMSWLCFKLPFCPFGHTRDTSVTHKKAKYVCFIHMQHQRVKFTSVQINMKQVSYDNMTCLIGNPYHGF